MSKVTKIAGFAFTGYDNLESVSVGKNVSEISPDAYSGCDKLRVLKIKRGRLTKKKIKNCLRGSGVKTISVMKSAWNMLDHYKEMFTKKNTGAKYKVEVRKSK